MGKRFVQTGLVVMAMAGGAAVAAATAMPGAEASVTRALHVRLPRTVVTKVDCGAVAGLCEVQSGDNLFYTDVAGRYLVIGRVYDLETRQDLTAARLLAINPDMIAGTAVRPDRDNGHASPAAASSDVSTRSAPAGVTPLHVSLKPLSESGAIAWGRGATRVTVFSDFRCGYCKLLHEQLKAMNVRVIERPISLLGTRTVSNAVLCSADRPSAIERAYRGEDLPATECDTSGLDANEHFAREHGFDGTPVLVREDGAVLQGYRPRQVLEAWLAGGTVS